MQPEVLVFFCFADSSMMAHAECNSILHAATPPPQPDRVGRVFSVVRAQTAFSILFHKVLAYAPVQLRQNGPLYAQFDTGHKPLL